jgi:type VI secretion system protein ImpC
MSGQVSFGRLAGQHSDGGGGGGAFRILVMGDFSARAGRGVREGLAGRKRIGVDVDNWERVLGSLGAEVRIPAGEGEIVLAPKEIDDFHPDFLYSKLEVFRALRELRQRLMDSSTFNAAADEIRSWAGDLHGQDAHATHGQDAHATHGQDAHATHGQDAHATHGQDAHATHGQDARATHGQDARATHGQDARATHGRDAHATASEGEAQSDLLGRLLGQRPAGADAPASGAPKGAPRAAGASGRTAAGAADSLIRGNVGPYIVPDRDKEQSALVACVDKAVAEQMRRILHHPNFQALEAAWRGVQRLVTHLETDEDLRLAVMDVSKDELSADVLAVDDLQTTALYDLLVAKTLGTQGAKPWSVLCAAFAFDKTVLDAAVLGRLSKIVHAARAPLVAGAADRVAGCQSIAAEPDPRQWTWRPDADAQAAWDTLRSLPEANWVALGLPRILMRQPYGQLSDSVDGFDFEELDAVSTHEDYLWCCASFALAEALGAAFADQSWDMAAEMFHDVTDLPAHIYRDADGDRQVKPCAEVCLTDRAAQAIQDQGLTALLSVQGQNVIRIRGIAAVAEPVAALAGPWG